MGKDADFAGFCFCHLTDTENSQKCFILNFFLTGREAIKECDFRSFFSPKDHLVPLSLNRQKKVHVTEPLFWGGKN